MVKHSKCVRQIRKRKNYKFQCSNIYFIRTKYLKLIINNSVLITSLNYLRNLNVNITKKRFAQRITLFPHFVKHVETWEIIVCSNSSRSVDTQFSSCERNWQQILANLKFNLNAKSLEKIAYSFYTVNTTILFTNQPAERYSKACRSNRNVWISVPLGKT